MPQNILNRGSYTSGYFIWNLCNAPLASFINFVWNDNECKILFIIWPFKKWFYRLQNNNISKRIHIADTDVVNNVTCSHQSVITRVVIQFLWYDVIHWITATSYDNQSYQIHLKRGFCLLKLSKICRYVKTDLVLKQTPNPWSVVLHGLRFWIFFYLFIFFLFVLFWKAKLPYYNWIHTVLHPRCDIIITRMFNCFLFISLGKTDAILSEHA